MSLTDIAARSALGSSDVNVRRELNNLNRDMDRRKWEYQMQKESNDYRAAATSGLIGSTLGMAKGAYGMYQDQEHQKGVEGALKARGYFPEGPAGEKSWLQSVGKNQGRSVLEDTFMRSRLPMTDDVTGYMTRQGLIDKDAAEQMRRESWLDQMMDVFTNTPRF